MKLISIVGIVAAVIAYVTAGKMRSNPSGAKPANSTAEVNKTHGNHTHHSNKTHGNNTHHSNHTLANSTHGNKTSGNSTKKQRKF